MSHDNYKYVIENCDKIVRGDRIREHFQRNSKLQVLDEAKKNGCFRRNSQWIEKVI